MFFFFLQKTGSRRCCLHDRYTCLQLSYDVKATRQSHMHTQMHMALVVRMLGKILSGISSFTCRVWIMPGSTLPFIPFEMGEGLGDKNKWWLSTSRCNRQDPHHHHLPPPSPQNYWLCSRKLEIYFLLLQYFSERTLSFHKLLLGYIPTSCNEVVCFFFKALEWNRFPLFTVIRF